MYLLFETNHTSNESIAIGDGSYLKLVTCEEGYFITDNFQSLVDEQDGWSYTEVESVTQIDSEP